MVGLGLSDILGPGLRNELCGDREYAMSDKRSEAKAVPVTVQHIRRCHVCGHTNESEGSAVRRCEHCGKHLAPFFYFDESGLEGLEEKGPYLSLWKLTPLQEGQYTPIWGLSTYWQESHEGQHRGYT